MLHRSPESLLADMLAETAAWRAVCAAVGGTLAAVEAAAANGTGSGPAARGRAISGGFSGNRDADDYLAKPRATVQQLEPETFSRYADAHADEIGSLTLVVEFDGPIDAATYGEGYDFARRVARSVASGLVGLPLGSGRLDLAGVVVEQVGAIDPKETDGETGWSAEFTVQWRGATG